MISSYAASSWTFSRSSSMKLILTYGKHITFIRIRSKIYSFRSENEWDYTFTLLQYNCILYVVLNIHIYLFLYKFTSYTTTNFDIISSHPPDSFSWYKAIWEKRNTFYLRSFRVTLLWHSVFHSPTQNIFILLLFIHSFPKSKPVNHYSWSFLLTISNFIKS